MTSHRWLTALWFVPVAALLLQGAAHAQQVADTTYDVSVGSPAHGNRRVMVAIDEAHANYHTLSGRYAPLARLLGNDGMTVAAGTAPFSLPSLAGIDILIIANAGPAGSSSAVRSSAAAFTEAEAESVVQWVESGGSLLLIADHAPYGASAASLAARFDVQFGAGWVLDSSRAIPGEAASVLAFTTGALGDHPITRGRSERERVHQVAAFTGQSMMGPPHATSLLRFSEDAVEIDRPGPQIAPGRPVGGHAQGLALERGRGRVVVLGEASMMSAQLAPPAPGSTSTPRRMGMNYPGYDNKQFALNVLRWLSRELN